MTGLALWRRYPGGVAGAAICLALTLAGLAVPLIAPQAVGSQVGPVFAPPGAGSLMGLDDGGRDVLVQTAQATLVSLRIGVAAALVSVAIGTLVGVTAGLAGGWMDRLLMGLADYVLALPFVPFALVLAATWGTGAGSVVVLIGVLFWGLTARVLRARTLTLRQAGFVERARAMGAPSWMILTDHILPHLAALITACAALATADAIFIEATVAFLGLGDPDSLSLGRMIGNAYRGAALSAGAWWAVAVPGAAIALVVLGAALIARALETAASGSAVRTQIGRPFRVGPPA